MRHIFYAKVRSVCSAVTELLTRRGFPKDMKQARMPAWPAPRSSLLPHILGRPCIYIRDMKFV